MAVQRINLIGVPVDVCRPEELEPAILELLAKPGSKQIIFLSIWKLLRARRKRGDFRECVQSADLILPISKSILSAARFLKLPVPVRYNPFSATINILSALDQHYRSLYLLGGRDKTLFRTEKNVHETFRGIQIVGRFTGYYKKQLEGDIVQSIYKASPSLALVSEGIKERDLWSYRRRNRFSSSIFLYYKDAFGIFSDRIRRVDEKTFDKGHEIWHEILHNPLKLFLAIPFVGFILVLLWYKVFKKAAPTA